jgi:hypothetical protein
MLTATHALLRDSTPLLTGDAFAEENSRAPKIAPILHSTESLQSSVVKLARFIRRPFPPPASKLASTDPHSPASDLRAPIVEMEEKTAATTTARVQRTASTTRQIWEQPDYMAKAIQEWKPQETTTPESLFELGQQRGAGALRSVRTLSRCMPRALGGRAVGVVVRETGNSRGRRGRTCNCKGRAPPPLSHAARRPSANTQPSPQSSRT